MLTTWTLSTISTTRRRFVDNVDALSTMCMATRSSKLTMPMTLTMSTTLTMTTTSPIVDADATDVAFRGLAPIAEDDVTSMMTLPFAKATPYGDIVISENL